MMKRTLAVVLVVCTLLVPQSVRASTETSTEEGPGYWSDWRNIVGWSLLGGGAVFFGTWVGAWVRVDGFENDPVLTAYQMEVPAGADICDYAETDASNPSAGRILDLCEEANGWAMIWNVTLPLWVMLWGTGAGLLIWYGVNPDPDADGTAAQGLRLAWSPYPLRSGGGIGLTGWF